jgi:hypothetical protein
VSADLPEDKLEAMFELRRRYMSALTAHLGHVEGEQFDLCTKEGQRNLRDMSLRGVEEVFEALAHLKNWKPHRKTDVPDFDHEKFLEEWIDAFNFFLSVLVRAGFTPDDVFQMYLKKDRIIHERLTNGY